MSSPISEVISITISRETVVQPLAGFGTLLIMGDLQDTFSEGYPVAWSTRYKEYSELSELQSDGFTITGSIYKAAQAVFSQNPRPEKIAVGYYDSGAAPAETFTTGIAAVQAVDNTWYGLVVTDRTDANAGDAWEAAQWVETAKKLMIIANDDTNIKDSAVETTSLAYLVSNANYERTAVMYAGESATTTDVKGWADAAWFGRVFPTDPGSANWAFMQLTGINPDDTLTSGERTIITDKNCNIYDSVGGTAVTRYGTVGKDSTYLDQIRFADWLESDMSTRIFSKMVSLDKIPFTDAGIGIVTGAMRASLEEAVRRVAITEDFTITAPKAADVSASNKAARTLPDVTFTAIGTGAINGVTITGVIQL